MKEQKYAKYKELLQQLSHIGHSIALMSWDQEIYMPPKGASGRADQISTLSGIHHDLMTAPELEDLVNDLLMEDGLNDREKRNLKETKKSIDKEKKLPKKFVLEFRRTVSESFPAWMEARKKNDYHIFEPLLDKIINLNIEKASLVGYEDHPYDAMMDDYEPGLKTAEVRQVFEDAKQTLVPLIEQISSKQMPDNQMLFQQFNQEKQKALSLQILKDLGYDLEAGRLDISEHPFTISFNTKDVRVTTRLPEKDFAEGFWSTIHEAGHGLYEQGLPAEDYGLPSGQAVSLGIHESQSRLYENNLGKSLSFIKAYLPVFQTYFPDQFRNVDADKLYRAVNVVKPGFIRTAADELTYHLHILIRFELETALMEKNLTARDLKDAWNSKYKEYLGLDITDDKKGVLQDIHWAHGSIGYFPTYSLGSFYAAQFYETAKTKITDLEESVLNKDFNPLLGWLREKIHQHGQIYSSKEVCEMVTGKPLDFSYFEQYALKKFSDIYQL